MAVPTFTSPVVTFNERKKLFKASYTVSGTTVKAEGVGDTQSQAKRHAVVTYRATNVLAFLDLPAQIIEIDSYMRYLGGAYADEFLTED